MKITGSREELSVLRRRIEDSQDRATSAESADLDYALELEDEWFAIHEKNAQRVKELEETRQSLSEARASALEEASASFDYPDLRWNTAEYETLVKVQKILKARAKTERRGAIS